MNTTATNQTSLKGGEWLIKESNFTDCFTPEEYNDEYKQDLIIKFLKDKCSSIIEEPIE